MLNRIKAGLKDPNTRRRIINSGVYGGVTTHQTSKVLSNLRKVRDQIPAKERGKIYGKTALATYITSVGKSNRIMNYYDAIDTGMREGGLKRSAAKVARVFGKEQTQRVIGKGVQKLVVEGFGLGLKHNYFKPTDKVISALTYADIFAKARVGSAVSRGYDQYFAERDSGKKKRTAFINGMKTAGHTLIHEPIQNTMKPVIIGALLRA